MPIIISIHECRMAYVAYVLIYLFKVAVRLKEVMQQLQHRKCYGASARGPGAHRIPWAPN